MATNQLEVPDDACVLIMDSMGDFKMIIPTPENPEEVMPLSIVFMTAIGLLVAKDAELFKYVMERFDEILEDYMEKVGLNKDVNNVLEFFAKNVERLRGKKV